MDTDFKMFCRLELKLPFDFNVFFFLDAAGNHVIFLSLFIALSFKMYMYIMALYTYAYCIKCPPHNIISPWKLVVFGTPSFVPKQALYASLCM